MTDGKSYELAEATYPLAVAGGTEGTILEEIRCLLDAGWTWDGDKLVHPQNRELWRKYTKMPGARQLVRRFRDQAAGSSASGNVRSGSVRSSRQTTSSPLRRAASIAAKASTPCGDQLIP